MTENGAETNDDASAEVEECEFVASYYEGLKVRIRHRFERKKILISTEVVHKATDHPFRAGVLILTPTIHAVFRRTPVPDEEEIEFK